MPLWTPSYAQGFARNAAESVAPELWRGLVFAGAPFLGATGNILHDWSGRHNNGIISDPATMWVHGQYGPVLDFDGDNDKVDCGSSNILRPTEAITVSAWIKLDAYGLSGDAYIAGVVESTIFSDGQRSAWFLRIGVDGTAGKRDKPVFGVRDSSGFSVSESPDAVNLNEWIHLLGTYDKSNVRIYVNGIEKDSTANTDSINYRVGTEVCQIGTDADIRWLDGHIDDVLIYNRALSLSQIQQLSPNRHIQFQPEMMQMFAPVAEEEAAYIPRILSVA